MSRLRLIVFVALVVIGGALIWFRPWQSVPAPTTISITTASGETLTITRDPAEIFRRAFWRHPSAADHIVHAERREWKDAGDVRRWQWFIELQPSPELLRTLRDPAQFNLVRIGEPRPWTDATSAPAWFPTTTTPAFEVHQSPGGAFTLLYRVADNTLFATDAGHGFAAAIGSPPRN